MGRVLRARSGFGRLAEAVPEATLVGCTVEGTVDISRFPKRPRVRVRFFAPQGGARRPDESPAALTARLMEEIRRQAPIAHAGRKPKPVAAPGAAQDGGAPGEPALPAAADTADQAGTPQG
jgi:1-acyl-sn-glycerol-3-phosphate acyltransferase